MFRKYEKTFRVDSLSNKMSLTKDELKSLFSGQVAVEEKMDGANVGIIRHKKGFHLQKRGSLVGQSEHEQFGFFHNWANVQHYTKIMNVPPGFLIYGELLYAVHSIYYDKLPDYVLIFDVMEDGEFLSYNDRIEFCKKYEFHSVPLIDYGHHTKETVMKLVPKESAYGEMAEGIVVKRYAKNGYTRGKIVKPEFQKILEESEHWTEYHIRRNKVVVIPE